MSDYILTIGAIAALAGITLHFWRRVAGPPRTSLRSTGRVALVMMLAIVVVGVSIYRVTKSRSFQLAGDLVQRVETRQKVIALTFDDGPTPGYTEAVLNTLRAHDASATFYLTGKECEDHPELLKAIVEAGHEIGNHTYSHRRMYFLPEAAVSSEVERTDTIFRSAGYRGPITFRMPGCKRLLTTPIYLARTNRTTVIWDLEPDSIAGIAADSQAIVENVVGGARPGSIILMHIMYDSREPTREALPQILEQLKAQGYRFVTVSELLAMR